MASKIVPERPAVSLWFTAPGTVELRVSTVRPPGPDEVRIAALFSGISHGSEMMVYRGEVPTDAVSIRVPICLRALLVLQKT